jgi:hypothetical protein
VALGLSDAAQAVTMSYSIDDNVQEQLDVIGRIVVMEKPWNSVSDDETYRLLLRSKIAKNNSDCTIQSIITAMQYIVPLSQVIVTDFEDMTMGVSFLQPITSQQINILLSFDLVPKPQGVRFRHYTVIPFLTMFGRATSQWGGSGAQYNFYQ